MRPESIEIFWYRLIQALADKEHELLLQIQNSEHLQSLVDKVEREIEQSDHRITQISLRISKESHRFDKIHRIDARNIAEALETEIMLLEKPIEEIGRDCHILLDANHKEATRLSDE